MVHVRSERIYFQVGHGKNILAKIHPSHHASRRLTFLFSLSLVSVTGKSSACIASCCLKSCFEGAFSHLKDSVFLLHLHIFNTVTRLQGSFEARWARGKDQNIPASPCTSLLFGEQLWIALKRSSLVLAALP